MKPEAWMEPPLVAWRLAGSFSFHASREGMERSWVEPSMGSQLSWLSLWGPRNGRQVV
jgi:hypothetical protein